ncbi:LuxR C-terminal-related transcriptional regulator [Saccharopolyspora sp. ASAGF58]|uniref:ATP-binding protein n=1 Tax=Saccharopolyspora sp. ASAGF58 TaxID=2719023 RepID=UPI00143FE2E7|nr:LuxR C-terminal-related transcriptional regulator [Saccharopolyspora sp. ASAGF58]QIZ37140.1 LuxR family transcriptional regulator [Saccharopolyspora sp. ASAGF58]
MAEVRRALSESRLVTLTGVGGVGKSRLALHLGHQLRRAFRDGVWLVELASLQDPSLVPQAVAAALGLRDQSAHACEAGLVDYLSAKQLLVVLDNCEHVLSACSTLMSTLLAAAPAFRVLATSREPLNISGESVWQVQPLSLPAMDMSTPPGLLLERPSCQFEALALFEDRVASAAPGFTVNAENKELVARLCHRLDGVPLAIELAAVRLRVLSLEEVLGRLDDRFRLLTAGHRSSLPRQQSLRAAVEWSFDLCTEQERVLWARCSVFAADFDLDAVEHVCAGDELSEQDVLIALAGLVDKSVLTHSEKGGVGSYRMLETIRQYGRERLAEAGAEATLHHRHRDYFLGMAERADSESCGPRQSYWGEQLRAKHPDFWAALSYCLTTPGEAWTGVRLCTALWFYWIGDGFVQDGRYWLDRALALDTEPSRERARALWLNGWIAHFQGDYSGSVAMYTQCRELAERLGDENMATLAIQFLGDSEMWEKNLHGGTALLDEALARHRAAQQWTAPALIIFPLRAQVAGLQGDTELMMALLDECRAIVASLGESWALSWCEWNVGVGWWAAGNPKNAAVHLRAALRRKTQLNDQMGIPCCVEVLSWVASADKDWKQAAMLCGAVDVMWERIGRPLFGSPTLLEWKQQVADRVRDALGDQAFQAAQQEGARLTQRAVIACALGEKKQPDTATAARHRADHVLTRRERQVAALVTQGMSNKEIAVELVIAQRTVDSHVEHILAKLGFHSRAQIATWIIEARGETSGERARTLRNSD